MRTGSMRVAEVSLPAIRHNVRRIRDLTGGGNVIAIMKANGYGHGAVDSARAAIEAGAALIGVTDLEEALSLRDAGISAPILCWLHGAGADFRAAVRANLEIGISHLAQLEAVAAAAAQEARVVTVQFKVDTGLSRNGAAPTEWQELFARGVALQQQGCVLIRGIFSHLANAGHESDQAQARVFDEAVAVLRSVGCEPELIHLAASAATFSSPELHYNTVRVGMTVFGLSPFVDKTSAELGLRPAMTLRSEIVAMRQVSAGTGVSYGYNHIVQSDTTLALVPIGYADGMPRALNGAGATVAISGQQFPIVGRIGMDQCIVDLGRHGGKVSLGEPVVLFGDPQTGVPPVEVWADLMRTINYEIVVGIGNRVLRVATEGAAQTVQDEQSVVTGRFDTSDENPPVHANVLVPKQTSLTLATPEDMHQLGCSIGGLLVAGDLVVLTGQLGAGKTTFTRGLGEGLGVRGPVTSPTFVLARTHPSLVGGAPLVHLDAYRLNDIAELDDIDIDFEYSVVVAEWGEGLINSQQNWLEISIERPIGAAEQDADAELVDWSEAPVEPRTVRITGHGPRWAKGVL